MTTTPLAADSLPEGEFAIVEVLGHRTLVGRVTEIQRFGSSLLQVEPFFTDMMLGPVLIGGGSIYQLTPVTAEVAYAQRPQQGYQLPPPVQATVPALALAASMGTAMGDAFHDARSDFDAGDEELEGN
jgi:hypothetical protein